MLARRIRAAVRQVILGSPEGRPARGRWDVHFHEWVETAAARGLDANDIGDEAWANDHLAEVLEDRYLRYVPPGASVLELGPGTGRLTRHLVGRAGRLELVDNSKFVIEWIAKYLRGKIEFRAHLVNGPLFPQIADSSVDTALAHGVFEHLDFDETYGFLVEFRRVLKDGGQVSFNYDTLHSEAGARWFLDHYRAGRRCIFRMYTPAFMSRVAEVAGFKVVRSIVSDDRLAHIVLVKEAR
ncbi:MAG TPA: class I SAM-dependent methyltransferase [Hyphomicrobiaceae bacterium]|nr:class I SAM-dependent methyltransferase [Hyphomicrobiaceae bacterium]